MPEPDIKTEVGILFNFEKGENPTICDKVDYSGRPNAKWNKSATEGQMLHDSTYMSI